MACTALTYNYKEPQHPHPRPRIQPPRCMVAALAKTAAACCTCTGYRRPALALPLAVSHIALSLSHAARLRSSGGRITAASMEHPRQHHLSVTKGGDEGTNIFASMAIRRSREKPQIVAPSP